MANSESFKNVTEGIRNLLVALSIVIGGGWAVFEFNAMLKIETARADLALKEATVAVKWSEMGAPLNFSISSRVLPSARKRRLLSVEVSISNPGKRGATLNIEDQPLRASEVIERADGKLAMGPVHSVTKIKLRGRREQSQSPGETAPVSHIVVLPGQVKVLPFLISLSGPGTYLVEFRAHLDENAQQEWIKAGMPAERTKNWAASKYIHVK